MFVSMSLAIDEAAVLWTEGGEADFRARVRVFNSGLRYIGGLEGSTGVRSDGCVVKMSQRI